MIILLFARPVTFNIIRAGLIEAFLELVFVTWSLVRLFQIGG